MKSYSDKVFFVGENDWTWQARFFVPLAEEDDTDAGAARVQKGGSNLNTFYSTIENWSGSGSMMWSIFGHGACFSPVKCCVYSLDLQPHTDDRCCDWIYHVRLASPVLALILTSFHA